MRRPGPGRGELYCMGWRPEGAAAGSGRVTRPLLVELLLILLSAAMGATYPGLGAAIEGLEADPGAGLRGDPCTDCDEGAVPKFVLAEDRVCGDEGEEALYCGGGVSVFSLSEAGGADFRDRELEETPVAAARAACLLDCWFTGEDACVCCSCFWRCLRWWSSSESESESESMEPFMNPMPSAPMPD